MKTAKRNFSQDSRSKGWDFKLGPPPPEHGGVLPTWPRFTVTAPTITRFSSIKSCIRPCFCTLNLIYKTWWGYLHFACLVTSVTGKTFDSISVYDLQCLATLLSWFTKFALRTHDLYMVLVTRSKMWSADQTRNSYESFMPPYGLQGLAYVLPFLWEREQAYEFSLLSTHAHPPNRFTRNLVRMLRH